MNQADAEYNRLAQLVLDKGRVKKNRTGIDTIGVFGAQARFDLQEGFPLLTGKKVFTKGIVHELLWFLSGSTNIKYLVDNGVNIWNENAYAKYQKDTKNSDTAYTNIHDYVNAIKLANMELDEDRSFVNLRGGLGEGTYGGMWRAFPTELFEPDYDVKPEGVMPHAMKRLSVDQIQKVIDKLKSNPDDRRLIVSAWHPYWVDHCALPPCHCLFQFHTEELTLDERRVVWGRIFFDSCDGYDPRKADEEELDKNNVPKRRLNCQLYQRSCDLFLGVPFNIASYALLTSMMAQVAGMVPGEFIHTFGDLHIYTNHLDQIKEQIAREPKNLPRLVLNPAVTDLFKFTYDDIKIEGYDPHPAIKGEMAV